MKSLNIPEFVDDKCSIKVTDDDNENEIKVKFAGKISARNPNEIFDPFFESLAQKLQENNIKHINLDTIELEYINSSAIRMFIDWINSVKKLPIDKRCNIKFLYNANSPWQESTFSMFFRTFSEIVSLQEYDA